MGRKFFTYTEFVFRTIALAISIKENSVKYQKGIKNNVIAFPFVE